MNRLKQLRTEKGLLQSDIAKIIGKTDRAVGQYEREERDPSSETWAILADYFDVSLDYIMGKTDIRNPQKKLDFDKSKLYFALSKEDESYISDELKDKILEFAKFAIEQEKKKKNK